jgi:GNAT superfamily N-acetyltransferase
MNIVQNMDDAIEVLREASAWMGRSGKTISKWWDPKNLNRQFLLRYAKESEFYVCKVEGKNATAAVLQIQNENASWSVFDQGKTKPALYIHWLAVARSFAGTGKPKEILELSKRLAKTHGVSVLRVDTNASEPKLKKVYEDLGFEWKADVDEGYRVTSLYEVHI